MERRTGEDAQAHTWARELKHHGWRWWLGLVRRGAPWALLLLALSQVKRLNDEVRRVESQEFSQVESEVHELRQEISGFRIDAMRTRAALAEARSDLRAVDEALEQARKHAPGLVRGIGDTAATLSSVEAALPPTDTATRLAADMQAAGGQLQGLRAALPPTDAAASVASSVTAVSRSLGDLRAGLPEASRVAQLSAQIDATNKRLDAVAKSLPALEQAKALGELLEADVAAVKRLQKSIPSDEELQALRRLALRGREAPEQTAAAASRAPPKSPDARASQGVAGP